MDKTIWKSIEEWPYFLGNVLVGVKVVFLSNYPSFFFLFFLSLLKYRGVGEPKTWEFQIWKAP